MELNHKIRMIKEKVVPILKKNGVSRAGLFGSYARGEDNSKSDVDLLIDLPKGMGYGFFKIQSDIEKN